MPATTHRAYDLELTPAGGTPIGLMLRRSARQPAMTGGTWGPGEQGRAFAREPVPRVWRSFSGGMGYGYPFPGVEDGYSYMLGASARAVPGAVVPAGSLTEIPLYGAAAFIMTTAAEYRGNIYFGGLATFISTMVGGTANPTIATSGNTLWTTDSMAIFKDTLYVGGAGNVAGMLQLNDATWGSTPATVTGIHRRLAVVNWTLGGVPEDVMLGLNLGQTAFRFVAGNPMVDADWTYLTTLGAIGSGGGYPVMQIVTTPHHAYFVCQDGIRDVDAFGRAPNLSPHWAKNVSARNGSAVWVHEGYLYSTFVHGGLERMPLGSDRQQESPEQCGPTAYLPANSPIYGWITAMAGVDGWVAANVCNGVDSYLCFFKGREQPGVPAGPGPVLWHGAEVYLPGEEVLLLHVTALGGDRRLLIGSYTIATGVPHLRSFDLPLWGTPVQEYSTGGYTFQTASEIHLTAEVWGDPTAEKELRRYVVRADNLRSTDTTLAVSASVDAATTFSAQGTAAASPTSTFRPSSAATVGSEVVLKLVAANPNNRPYLLRALEVDAKVRPRSDETLTYFVTIETGQELSNGAAETRDQQTTWRQLYALRGQRATLVDQFDQTYTVSVDDVLPHEYHQEDAEHWRFEAQVVVTIVERPFYLDSGARLDSGEVLG